MAETRKRQSKTLTLEQAISLLQEAGFTIEAPALAAQVEKKKAAPQALGFSFSQQPKPKVMKKGLIPLHLTFSHSINGRVFGPGETVVKSPELASHLLNADRRAIEQENRVFDSVSRSYLIVERKTPSGRVGPSVVDFKGLDLSQLDNVPLYGEYRA